MKKYYNSETKQWYYEGSSITIYHNNTLFSGVPTEEQLIEFGFTEVVDPEPTEQELLEKAKLDKISDITSYDSSSSVNSFSINGQDMWLDAATRQLLRTSIQAYKDSGITNVTKWFSGLNYTFTADVWLLMLNALEIYAAEALNITESHKADVLLLTTIADVESYDITVGYPTKLSF